MNYKIGNTVICTIGILHFYGACSRIVNVKILVLDISVTL